jgi:retron-type reverse transcriptase
MNYNSFNPVPLFRRIASVPALYQGWRKVRANRGAPGIDAMSLRCFEARLDDNLRELSRSLLSKSYQAMPARFVTIAKANGRARELAILTVRDRVAQRTTLDAIEPLFEPQFLDCNFAFRPARSVEMAIQRMIAARANGYWWTVESDVQDFFGTIDRKLLLTELEQTIGDKDVLHLLAAWLDAGALEQDFHLINPRLWRRGKEAAAGFHLLMRDALNQSLDGYIADHLGVGLDQGAGLGGRTSCLPVDYALENSEITDVRDSAQEQGRRESVKRLIQDGALLAISERALIGRLLGLKLLGVGGLAVTAAVFAPKAVRAYRDRFHPKFGTPQGAPISPLLTNAYMTPFDSVLTRQGWRLIRYCDDFVLQCRGKEEAQAALVAAEAALAARRLRMHPDKTRIVAPNDEFEFLGYIFAADGSVIPPPTVPEQMAQQIKSMARRAVKWRRR